MTTSSSNQARRLVFPAKQQVLIEPFDPGKPAKGQVLVRTQLSLMSTGTENIVFNRLFDPGTHWDNWVKYPFYPGYTSVGIVEALGEDVTMVKAGDRVAFRQGHRSHAIVDEVACYSIPDELPFEQAAWFALAKITFVGALAADYRLGDSALVIGAGPIGQMSIRWASAAGLNPIIAIDTAKSRMPLAQAGGATDVITAPITEAREALQRIGRGRLPKFVIDSTGNAAVFSAALGLVADRGRVVIMGDTGSPASQTLTTDVITRGISIVGAHDLHNTVEWHDATIVRYFYSLVTSGRFSLEGLTSHVFTPDQCAEAYLTANRDRSSTMGLIFDWANILKK